MTLEQTIMAWAGVIIAVGGALAVIYKLISPLVKKTKSLLNNLDRFTNDWFGTEEAPGRDAVPGVMERLNRIDGELKHNGGSSMKDSLKRVENKLKQIDGRLEEGNQMFVDLNQRVSTIEGKIDL
jgi:hypothetical protein